MLSLGVCWFALLFTYDIVVGIISVWALLFTVCIGLCHVVMFVLAYCYVIMFVWFALLFTYVIVCYVLARCGLSPAAGGNASLWDSGHADCRGEKHIIYIYIYICIIYVYMYHICIYAYVYDVYAYIVYMYNVYTYIYIYIYTHTRTVCVYICCIIA